MKNNISFGISILLFILLAINIDALCASTPSHSPASIAKTDSPESLLLTSDTIKGNPTYEYIIQKDLKLHLSLSEELFRKPTGIFLDSFEISKYFSKSKDGHMAYISDFNIKPGKHTLVIDRQNIEITAIYVFDTDKHFDNIKNTWQSRDETFAKQTKNGILLKNTTRPYGSFAFKRFYNDDITVAFDFVPINFQPGLVIYFGDNIYFMINSTNIMTMKKGENKHRDSRVGRTSIPRIQNNSLYDLEIRREAGQYTVLLNGISLPPYRDDNISKNQRFHNIGISMSKNGGEILLKKIMIK